MTTTFWALYRKTPLILLLVLLSVPFHQALAQVSYCDQLTGTCATEFPDNTLQQSENELQSTNNAFEQAANYLTTSEDNLKQEYGLTPYSDCYEQSAACSEDTATQLGASECIDTLQSCLQEYEKTLQE